VPVPFAPVLENAYRPDPARVIAGIRQVLNP
jgi:pyruvate/2-oxoglutarate/acetoin dehydrogenase E1 component